MRRPCDIILSRLELQFGLRSTIARHVCVSPLKGSSVEGRTAVTDRRLCNQKPAVDALLAMQTPARPS